MNRWNKLKNECDSSGPVYQNVQTLKSEIERLNEICKSAKKDSNRLQKDQLLHHQQILESALADLELSAKPLYPDINGNQYYSQMPQNTKTITPTQHDSIHHHVPDSAFSINPLYANITPTKTIGRPANSNHGNQIQSTVNGSKARNIQTQAQTSTHVQLFNNTNNSAINNNIYANLPRDSSLIYNNNSTSAFRTRSKADHVDHLTDLLVKSMESSNEPDFFGMCNKCGEKVVGEGSGCTAMEMVYHIQCFTCTDCQKELRGKSFYALENNPFCEDCYLNTLEKCCVCEKPILDRILRATGKPYHPSCFTCVICRKSLDGIPFTVDATNQVHCIDCFHEKFAPRCSVCKAPIVPEQGKTETVRVVALDRSFHVACYKCEDCDLLLSSEAEGRGCYPLDDHILCRNCNAKRVQAITA